MKNQISVLSKICKVGPYACDKTYHLPQTSDLLTYLYQEVLNITDKDLALVLYSAFYPCCEIYFRRFLQQWLFEGTLVDPYEEFLINIEEHYTNYRTRVYWTRNFSLKQNALPEFLFELKNSILLCGKTMNLLKLCKPDTPLCRYTIDQSSLITCCLTSDRLTKMKQSISLYYIEVASLCGPRISLAQKLREREEEQEIFLSKVKQKQALTLRRIELERQKIAEEKAKHKRKLYEDMQEQIRIAKAYKKKEAEEQLKYDLQIAEQNAQMEQKKAELLKQESKFIVNYYDELFQAIEIRRASIEKIKKQFVENTNDKQDKHTESEKAVHSKLDNIQEEKMLVSACSSDEIFYDSKSEVEDNNENESQLNNIDALNANIIESQIENVTEKETDKVLQETETTQSNEEVRQEVKRKNIINEAFLEAQRNRAKIMNLEFGQTLITKPKPNLKLIDDNSNLTEAQKNKLKVMRAEYQMFYQPKEQKNTINDNEKDDTNKDTSFISDNMASPGQELVMNINHRNNILSLPKHIEQINNKNKNININAVNNLLTENEVTPMSVGSTPNTEYISDFPTPSSSKMYSTDITLNSACTLDTASSNFTDDGFKFPTVESKDSADPSLLTARTHISEDSFKVTDQESKCSDEILQKKIKIKVAGFTEIERENKLEKKDASDILNNNIKYLLHQSIFVPLQAQMRLVNNEILKYFLDDQKLFSHLHSLRCYFFLLDGEFGRHITEGIFNKLYEVRDPADLLNGRVLQIIMNKALCSSSKFQENSERLSFTIQNIPQRFNLSSADVLACLSLSYKINWPLNILLPFDTMEKYELVFKYLLKLHHVSWILQKTFQVCLIYIFGKLLDSNFCVT